VEAVDVAAVPVVELARGLDVWVARTRQGPEESVYVPVVATE